MNVGQAIQRARSWVEQQAPRIPGFHGAFLAGSLTRMAPETPLEPWRDVDVVMLTTDRDAIKDDRLELVHDGLVLECAVLGDEPFRSPERILGSAEFADNLAAGVILADPTGELGRLHQRVAVEHSRRQWVQARCEDNARVAAKRLAQARKALEAGELPAVLMHFYVGTVMMINLTSISNASPLTMRRCFVRSGELLEAQGQADLHEEALELIGTARLTRGDTERFLSHFDEAFRMAIQVKRQRVHYDFKFREHLRPYYVDGTREMIEAGRHREATFWIIGFAYQAWLVLLNDAPEELQQPHLERLVDFFQALDLLPTTDWEARLNRFEALLAKFSAAATERIRDNPALTG
ncbi:hypothetical protein HPC49_38705 [Pyxidicoccus fallax]|uniref:Uncharacterized protein n=1 Tax=Pyxidicoccus fallax TaxID=394095 RepID=A0A848LXA7_9BACT|nr:hypothetical protein [Pyxidicoccus fallax]NMO22182.1 hypothetical protein [Pyxidicoccus fallax]NPC84129.1 hypothetical protein [Pyxidicoccus fallax]